jgi:lipoprotein-anchoring transpeptidase ErfK/SrfK
MFSLRLSTRHLPDNDHLYRTLIISSLHYVKVVRHFRRRAMIIPTIAVAISVPVFGLPAQSLETSPTMRTTSVETAIANVSKAASIVNRQAPLSLVRRGPADVGYVTVVLDEQTTYVYSPSRRLIAVFPVSTGLDDTTPVGSYTVFSKSADTFYTPNPRERMRWMTRFTKGPNGGNIGFHSIPYMTTDVGEVKFPTPVGLAPSSHGCVRMRDADAKWLFDNISLGTVVTVIQSK